MIDDNLHIPIQKDIGDYEQKLFGDMSLRTCACLAGGFATAVLTALVCWFWLAVDPSDAAFPIMLATIPFWLAGFWRPCGMPFERFIPLAARHALGRRSFVYVPNHRLGGGTALSLEPARLRWKEKRKVYRKGAELYEPAEEE